MEQKLKWKTQSFTVDKKIVIDCYGHQWKNTLFGNYSVSCQVCFFWKINVYSLDIVAVLEMGEIS